MRARRMVGANVRVKVEVRGDGEGRAKGERERCEVCGRKMGCNDTLLCCGKGRDGGEMAARWRRGPEGEERGRGLRVEG